MTDNRERRQFWRAAFHSPVRLTTGTGQAYGQMIDISLKGVLLAPGANWQAKMGESCDVRLDLAPVNGGAGNRNAKLFAGGFSRAGHVVLSC